MEIETVSLNDIFTALQGGGNIALMVCVYFIRDASQRLARLEKALDVALSLSHSQAWRQQRGEEK